MIVQGTTDDHQVTYKVKNLSCSPLLLMLKEKLQELGFAVVEVKYGKITLRIKYENFSEEVLSEVLERYGMELVLEREARLVENIKNAVYELIHDLNNINSVVRRSDFLVEKMGYSYPYLSRLFSKHEQLTLEKYIIQKKIDRIKELVLQDEYTLSEMAYMMGYSSVQYLSSQFRTVTGESVSAYRKRVLSS